MADQVDLIIADLDRYTRGEVIRLGLNINANLRSSPPLGTPIRTGWASANWVPSVGTPYDDPGIAAVKDPTPADVASRAKVAQQRVNDVLSWRPEDGHIFSTNNVPYIKPLNNGHSGQSPRGFVLIAIERAVRQTKALAAEQGARNRRADAYRASRGKPPPRGRR